MLRLNRIQIIMNTILKILDGLGGFPLFGFIFDTPSLLYTSSYMNYNIERGVYDANTMYEGLIITKSSLLGVDTTIFRLKLMYVVCCPSTPMKITNDMRFLVVL